MIDRYIGRLSVLGRNRRKGKEKKGRKGQSIVCIFQNPRLNNCYMENVFKRIFLRKEILSMFLSASSSLLEKKNNFFGGAEQQIVHWE